LIAQHTPEQLQELQRKVVDAFAAQRPVSPDPRLCGMRHWTVDVSDDSSVYVKKEMENHVKAGVGHITEGGELIPYVQDWLSHYPDLIYPDLISPDLITRAVGAVMGADKSMQIAHKAAANENWWLAYAACFAWMLSMHAAGESAEMYSGQHSDGMTMFMNSFLRVDMQQPACLTKMQYEHWRLGAYMVFNSWVESAGIDAARNIYPTLTAEDAQRWSDSIPKLLETTDAGRAHPETPESWTNKIVMAKALKTDDWDTHDPIWLEDWQQKLRTAQKDGKGMIDLLQQLCGNQAVIRLPQWSWDHLSGDEVLAAMQGRDWALERLHYDDKAYNLACLGGDIPYMTATLDFARDNVKRLAAESEGPLSLRAMWLVASHCYPWVLRLLGRTQEAKSLMEQADLTWTSADASVDSYAESRDPGVRNRGAKPGPSDVFQVTAEDFSWSIRLQYVLCSTWRECPPDDVIADLPSPDTLVSYVTNIATRGTTGPGHGKHHRAGVRNLLLLAAEVCEKLERPDDALLYVAKALNNDPKDPYSDRRPTTQALGHSLRGRVLASQGKAAEAEAAFEEAVQAAHSKEMWLFEMLALRDLKVHVLDKDGRGEEGLRRLKVVLKEMKGAPAELTKLLGGGLDAEEILRHS
jgi:tetratricopeptide (TPR) repeat protein